MMYYLTWSFLPFRRFFWIGSLLSSIYRLVSMLFIAGISAVHSMVETLFIGGYALDAEGEPIVRRTLCGKQYFVKEPGLVRELIGLMVGGTIKRDALGHPKTDPHGHYVRDKGWLW